MVLVFIGRVFNLRFFNKLPLITYLLANRLKVVEPCKALFVANIGRAELNPYLNVIANARPP